MHARCLRSLPERNKTEIMRPRHNNFGEEQETARPTTKIVTDVILETVFRKITISVSTANFDRTFLLLVELQSMCIVTPHRNFGFKRTNEAVMGSLGLQSSLCMIVLYRTQFSHGRTKARLPNLPLLNALDSAVC